MIDSETKAIVQDSCERWHLCLEYIEKWSPGIEQRLAAERGLRIQMRAEVKEINASQRAAS